MAQLPVPAEPDTERRTQYSVTAQTGPLAVGFDIYGDASDYQNWIEVWVNGFQIAQAGNWTLASPSGTLSTLPRPISDATVTFAVAQTGYVDIVGARRPRRMSQFAENRGVAARDVNELATDQWMTQRERWDRFTRLMIAPPGETFAPLPPAVSRGGSGQGTLLGFDNAGQVKIYPNGTVLNWGAGIVLGLTRAQIPTQTITDSVFFVSGYSTAGDRGALAPYTSVGATSGGPGAIQDQTGTWFNLVVRERYNAAWFGAKGDGVTDDSAAIKAAATASGAVEGSHVWFPPGDYPCHDIIISTAWFSFMAERGTVILRNNSPTHQRITAVTTPDLTYPTLTTLGPLRGCAFYILQEPAAGYGISYFPHIEGILFTGYRFAITFKTSAFSPVIRHNKFENCNAGAFFYTGCQNLKMVNNFSDFTNVILLAGSTCFPAGSGFEGGTTYLDGLTLGNIDDSQQAQFSRLLINDYFDDWFCDSIIRPATDSISGYGTHKYLNAAGAQYVKADRHCRPSGGAIFAAARNTENYFEMYLTNICLVTQAYRGVGLVNTALLDFRYFRPQGESSWDPSQPDVTAPVLEVGNVVNGITELGIPELFNYTFETTHQLIKMNGRGGYGGSAVANIHLGTKHTPVAGEELSGFITDKLYGTTRRINQFQNDGQSFYVASGPVLFSPPLDKGDILTDHLRYTVHDGIPLEFPLPQYNAANTTHYSDALFLAFGSVNGSPPAGMVTIKALNKTEPGWDIGKFYIESGTYAGVTETLVTAANLNNGDDYVAVTTAPSNTGRGVRWTVAVGVTVVSDYYVAATKRIYLIGKCTGLAATVSSGANITRTQTIKTLKPFSRGWITFGLNVAPFSNAWNFGIKNNLQAYTDNFTKPSLDIQIYYKSAPDDPENLYNTAAPTTGMWAKGAIVWNTNPAAAGFIGWVCTVAGTPGTWNTFGVIS